MPHCCIDEPIEDKDILKLKKLIFADELFCYNKFCYYFNPSFFFTAAVMSFDLGDW